MKKPLLLMILDGWGINPNPAHNAVALANTPNLKRLLADYPHVPIRTSGMAVGLPEGQMGNSEVGHLNIGAGRVVYQELTRVTKAIDDGEFFSNPVLLDCIAKVKASGGRLHLSGLLSDGGVHSHNSHLYAFLELARREGLNDVFIHCLLDGRDTPPQSGSEYLAQLETEIARIGVGKIATVMGRYYAMDRDTRWDRVEKAYNAIVHGLGELSVSSKDAIEQSYDSKIYDEFVVPTVICEQGAPVGQLLDGDGFIFFNFRSDRAREITRAIALDEFDGFERGHRPELAGYVCLTEYDATFGLPIAFASTELVNILGGVLADAGLKQLRIAETEKYAHVTFFFNGGVETPFPGEDRALIPSPKDVATYDLKPEMSAYQVTDKLLKLLDQDAYDVIILNFANCDMVGHTGIEAAAIKAVETVDVCAGRIIDKVRQMGGAVLITADHGNAEQMCDENGEPFTAHTTNPVWLVMVDDSRKGVKLREGGRLADIAPTMLKMLGLEQPAEMAGESLL
ncbi:MAG TPA: 2,3-bisphosphoglycerate-independent phosphoglycerate mutase [Geobacter sp.]|nr:MAG: phosphoglycerate mutase (2,3-diphosphoglycerate-independent) [Geobacteraceae bacterium GWF2_54_21]HBA71572.1 2,3-bisphosphoglycerate-independent phosphoglycerate mutase [Geobacter sp.]HCE66354.1 2,3-bisphosphoglycerate-independent phosphoglycerate mutase [Geobacter sp.]